MGWCRCCGARESGTERVALIDDLLGSRIALDTAPLIYWIEDHTDYAPILYEAALTAGDIDLVALDVDALRVAAWLRAQFRVATPDAIQLACALASGCTTFVTNDRRLPDIPSLKIVQLADYLDAA